MTYVCTLRNSTGSVVVNFNNTYYEGDGPQLSLVNDVAVLDAPYDANGNTQSLLTDLKYCTDQWTLRGQFKDGLGNLDWNTPGSTNAEKLLALFKLEIVPLTLTWPVATKTQTCTIFRLTIGEQGAYGNTVTFDIGLQMVAGT